MKYCIGYRHCGSGANSWIKDFETDQDLSDFLAELIKDNYEFKVTGVIKL